MPPARAGGEVVSSYSVSVVPLEELRPYGRNARTHSDEQVDQIVALIQEFGWTIPILAEVGSGDGLIVAGHGRRLAALRIYDGGGTIRLVDGRALPPGTVPVIDCTGWSDDQRRAYTLADNQIALNAGWDEALLKLELGDLSLSGFDIGLAGFSQKDLASLLGAGAGNGDPEATPEPEAIATSRLGDIWLLGDHRIVCGDSTDAGTVAALLDGEKPHLMVTDPPYGVEYDPDWRNKAKRADGTPIGASAIGTVKNDGRADWREAWDLFPGDVAYVWHAGLFAGVVAESLISSRFGLRSQIVWAKSNFAIGRGDYHWKHEPCWYAVRKGAKGNWSGDRKQTTLWDIDKPQKSETGHGTQKPIECMKRPIENNSQPGDAIYEPFSGSGTTIIAAEMTGRRCFAIELNPVYVDIAVRRWQQFTGREATLLSGGATFANAEAARILDAA